MNATGLFNSQEKGESFWTSLFSLFLLHLAARTTSRDVLTIWHCTDGPKAPWYVRRLANSNLQLANVGFDDMAVEPSSVSFMPEEITPEAGYFPPDIVIRSNPGDGRHFFIIENKIKGHLQNNQIHNYPELIKWLLDHKISSFDFLILHSEGRSDALAQQTRNFQKSKWGADHFGILLLGGSIPQNEGRQLCAARCTDQ